MGNDDLRRVCATPFRTRDTDSVSRAEFVYTLSSDVGWCKPTEAEEIIETALEEGLIQEEEGGLRPAFDPVEPQELQDVNLEGVLSPPPDSVLEAVVDDLVREEGCSRKEAVAAVNRLHHDLGNIGVDAAAVVVAKREGLNVENYVDSALRKLQK